MSTLALVAVGGAVGAPARYLIDIAVARRTGQSFPWGTLVVNVAASLLLGVLVAAAGPRLYALLGTGFCGALSTYSTFSAETVALLDQGRVGPALGNIALQLGAGIAAAALGFWIGAAAW